MLKRKAERELLFWKEHKTTQGLLVTGARQVGKTFLIREFAKKHYTSFVEINLFTDKEAARFLDTARDEDDLFARISVLAKSELKPKETLIFIDEVQLAKEIVTAIKFLVQKRDYDFILSGSLLGVELNDIRSVPVGYLDTIEMFPLDFEEFTWANSLPQFAVEEARKSFLEKTIIKDFIHIELTKLFYEYLIVGGMPEAVSAFVQTNNLQQVRKIQDNILLQYAKDISQYSKRDALIIKAIYDLVPSELNNQNKRFILKNLSENGRFSKYQNQFEWLIQAGVTIPTYIVTEPISPLKRSKSYRLFKLFMSDVGLLTASLAIDPMINILSRNKSINFGAIFENFVAEELNSHSRELYYYNHKKRGEVDFIIETPQNETTLIEVKSGKDYKRHSALNNLLAVKEYHFKDILVFCDSNIIKENQITYLPNYLAFCL